MIDILEWIRSLLIEGFSEIVCQVRNSVAEASILVLKLSNALVLFISSLLNLGRLNSRTFRQQRCTNSLQLFQDLLLEYLQIGSFLLSNCIRCSLLLSSITFRVSRGLFSISTHELL